MNNFDRLARCPPGFTGRPIDQRIVRHLAGYQQCPFNALYGSLSLSVLILSATGLRNRGKSTCYLPVHGWANFHLHGWVVCRLTVLCKRRENWEQPLLHTDARTLEISRGRSGYVR